MAQSRNASKPVRGRQLKSETSCFLVLQSPCMIAQKCGVPAGTFLLSVVCSLCFLSFFFFPFIPGYFRWLTRFCEVVYREVIIIEGKTFTFVHQGLQSLRTSFSFKIQGSFELRSYRGLCTSSSQEFPTAGVPIHLPWQALDFPVYPSVSDIVQIPNQP